MRVRWWWLGGALAVVLVAAASPWLVRAWWSERSSNPVRRGVERARELGCFHCHGELGREGLPDPGKRDERVPAWSGGAWTRYVEDERQIQDYILDGSASHRPEGAGEGPSNERLEILMPGYRDVLRGTDLEDLTAAFLVLSGMKRPPTGSPERRGLELARRWRCFSCHGPAGAGGAPNPGSLTGFIPAWYGPDFEDLVRDREEFDAWVRTGSLDRLEADRLASFFMRRQRISMPAYASLTDGELDDLWAYFRWLARTGGGYEGVESAW